MPDYLDPSYLARGTPRQRAAYHTLMTLGIFRRLRAYRPVLTGTIPLNLDVPGSDLDIICEAPDLQGFAQHLRTEFGRSAGFRLTHKEVNGEPSVVAHFIYDGFPFEVFGQARRVTEQRAYRHLTVEARLLAIGGEPAYQAIRRLRSDGIKTEPAFAHHFNLPGDPYETLLELADLSDDELRGVVTNAARASTTSDE